MMGIILVVVNVVPTASSLPGILKHCSVFYLTPSPLLPPPPTSPNNK
jgi:hypothetical protein